MDRNYIGPCPSCCDPCLELLGGYPNIIVAFSGLTVCPCFIDNPAGSSSYKLTVSLNHSYELALETDQSYSLTLPNAASFVYYDTPDCTGDQDHTDIVDVIIRWSCVEGIVTIGCNVPSIGHVFFFSGEISSDIHGSVPNDYVTNLCTFNEFSFLYAPVYGGTCTLITP